jgi:hypothetical protein
VVLERGFFNKLLVKHKRNGARLIGTLLKWAVPTIGTALVTGIFSPVIAASGLAVAGLGEIIQAEMKRREFRKKVPMSVFIDLERK